MKTVGIMTWFSYDNYGTVLQAAAMCRSLSKLGLNPQLISYDPSMGSMGHAKVKKSIATKVAHRLLGKYHLCSRERCDKFADFRSRFLVLSPRVKSISDLPRLNNEYDAFLCGSDQVWSPRFFDPNYYLSFVGDDVKKVAYAPSFGCDSLELYGHASEIRVLLERFQSIGVRESSGARLVEECTGKKPPVVLDPTLLLCDEEWEGLSSRDRSEDQLRPYCLFYFLGYYKKNYDVALQIANTKGLSVVMIPVYQRDLSNPNCPQEAVGPDDFIALVRGAACVCTDSFHGCAFATLFGKELFAFERFDPKDPNSQNTRIYSFLETMGLRDRLITRNRLDSYSAADDSMYDTISLNKRIEDLRNESMDFLTSSLLGV